MPSENDGTYLQYPGHPLGRGRIAPNTPSVNASDLISESSSGKKEDGFVFVENAKWYS